jgi:hypothetical protein
MAMNHKPPTSSMGWRCAACGDLITRIENGWVEWLVGENDYGATRVMGLRLVHRQASESEDSERNLCRYDDRREFRKDQSLVEGLPLERFVGPDGLMLLLSLIAEDEMPRTEILELVKRVHIPGYEQTRELFHDAIHGGAIAPSIGEGFYMQSEMRDLFLWVVHGTSSPEKSVD